MYRKSTKQRLMLAALLAATATVVTLDFRENSGGPIRRIQDFAVSIVAPLQDGMAKIARPVGDFLSTLAQAGSLKEENSELQAEIDRLEADQRRLPEIERELERLRALTQQTDWASGAKVGARVIGIGPSNHEWTLFLDRGAADGLKPDMAVVSSEGLVGKVTLVGRRYSTVLMVIDPQHSAGARLTATGETGVLSGVDGERLRFELIDPQTPVQVGETIVTSGYDRGIFPPGIPIGRVASVSKTRDGLSQSAVVLPFVDFTRLDVVLILLESGSVARTG